MASRLSRPPVRVGNNGWAALPPRSVIQVRMGCSAFSGQVNWCYFMLPAAGSGIRRGLLAESYSQAPSGDVPYCTGVRCTAQCPRLLFFLSGRRYGRPARL